MALHHVNGDAAILLDAGLDQAQLEIPSAALSVGHQDLRQRRFPRTGHNRTALHCLVPRSEVEAEPGGTIPNREAAVIGALNFGPVVSAGAPFVGRDAQAASVVRNSPLRQTEPSGYLRIGQTRLAKPGYRGAFVRCPRAARSRARNNVTPLRCPVPGSIGEPEPLLALPDAVPVLVVGADRLPVVVLAPGHRTYVPIRSGRKRTPGLQKRCLRRARAAAGEGFEPSFPEPESGVLPARRPGIGIASPAATVPHETLANAYPTIAARSLSTSASASF